MSHRTFESIETILASHSGSFVGHKAGLGAPALHASKIPAFLLEQGFDAVNGVLRLRQSVRSFVRMVRMMRTRM